MWKKNIVDENKISNFVNQIEEAERTIEDMKKDYLERIEKM